jgi:uncharacterized cupredoxin-like copper-binding protein
MQVLTLVLAAALMAFPIAAQRPQPNVVTIEVTDYAFLSLPPTIPAGLTTIRLVNKGSTLHHLQLNRLREGREVREMIRDFVPGKPLPGYMSGSGGPSAAWAGQTIEATMVLEPGTYGVICWVPAADGKLHLQKGMIGQLTVGPASGASIARAMLPAPDIVITAFDYNYKIDKAITAGRRTIRFVNAGPQNHEFVLVRLAKGKTVKDAQAWAERGQTGEQPGTMLSGVAAIAPGGAAHVTNVFEPGEYAILCFVPSTNDRKGLPHVHYGMMQQIQVR